jgi:hypothetical protein
MTTIADRESSPRGGIRVRSLLGSIYFEATVNQRQLQRDHFNHSNVSNWPGADPQPTAGDDLALSSEAV